MAQVTCGDGCVLSVQPVPVLGRDGAPYEVTLRLLRDGEPFGEVGERCGWFLATTASRLRRAVAGGGANAFPESTLELGVRAWARDLGEQPDRAWAAAERHLPRDRELFAHLSRDPDDLAAEGELRASLRTERRWVVGTGWEERCLALLEAWGVDGTGVRAALTAADLLAFLDELVAECAAVGVAYDDGDTGSDTGGDGPDAPGGEA